MLVKNEDIYVEQAIRNVIEFCDHIIITDHQSSDRTYEICSKLALKFPKITLHRIDAPFQSAFAIKQYYGTNTWIFGVDGDEIYDPYGLQIMRKLLLEGAYSKGWCVFGNVLNVVSFEPGKSKAKGYLAPPSRSITKLYNFSIIEDWQDCPERLHGEKIVFKPGFDASMRFQLHEEISWEDSMFRCLHFPFMKRSSKQKIGLTTTRSNPDELMNIEFEKNIIYRCINKLKLIFLHLIRNDWKYRKYRRGPLIEKDITQFF